MRRATQQLLVNASKLLRHPSPDYKKMEVRQQVWSLGVVLEAAEL